MREARSIPPPAMAEAPVDRIGRFDLVRPLGGGAAGMVYEARDRESGARVALKTLRAMNGDTVLQLKSELRALQDIEHPNLMRLDELSCDGDRWFFTMELIDGVDFVQYVTGRASPGDASASSPVSTDRSTDRPSSSGRAFDDGRLRESLAQLARGLEALHASGKVHRDVKPENVLVTREGRVVIIDLGLVAEVDAAAEDDIVGTVRFMAPEQIAGDSVSAPCDWYAVGVILFVCLTGRYPFEGSMTEIVNRKVMEEPPHPRDLATGIPDDLADLCIDLLAREPADRATGLDLLTRLRSRAVSAAPPSRMHAKGDDETFIGREQELAALSNAFDEVAKGRTVAVLVQGESGIGKTALATRFQDWLAATYPDALYFSGRCHEREAVPYKALDGVVDAVSRYLSVLAEEDLTRVLPDGMNLLGEAFPVLTRIDLPKRDSAIGPPIGLASLGVREGRARFFAAMRDLFVRIAERPLVIAIDDMQWADADSLALLRALLRSPGAPPLFLVMTARGAHDDDGTPFDLPGDVRTITLGRLSMADGVALARARLKKRGADEESLARAIAAEAAGHPLFLDELARHAQSARGLAARRVSLDDVFRARIDRLDAAPRRLLEVLSVAGIPLRPSAVMRAAGVSPADYAALVRTLRVGHLARTVTRDGTDGLEVYHDRVRDAVCHGFEPTELRGHHARIARALEAGAKLDDDALATHWLAAGDRGRALHYTLLAADGAFRALAFERAALLYERAISFATVDSAAGAVTDDRGRQLARTRLAEAYTSLGRMPEAARAFAAAAADASTKAHALDLRRRQAESLLNCGAFDEGEAVMDGVLSAVGLSPDRSRASALLGFLVGRARLWWRGLDFVERSEEAIPPRELVRVDACCGIAWLLGPLDVIRSSDFQTKTLLFALDAGEPVRIVRALAVDAPITAARGPSAKQKTEETLARAASIALTLGAPHFAALVTVSRSFTDFLLGDFRAARANAFASLAALRQSGSPAFFEMRMGEMVEFWSLAWLGSLGELARRLETFLATAPANGDLYAATTMRTGPPSIIGLRGDDPVAARAAVHRASAKWTQPGYHTPHYWGMYADAQIDLYEGQGHAAWTRIQESWPKMRRSLMMSAQVVRLEATFLRARAALAAAVENPSLEPAMIRSAARDARDLEDSDAVYGTPLANLVRASLETIGGREDAARSRLGEALIGFENVGMRLHAEATRWRLGALLPAEEGRLSIDAAETWARGEGIVHPARMFGLIAPGFVVSASARPRL